MKAAKKKKPQVVPGTVIGVSALMMGVMMATMAIFSVGGIGMVLAWLFTKDSSIWLLVVGLLAVVICPAAIAMGVYRLRIKERLILGADRLQIVHRIQGEDQVIAQVPYANVALLRWEGGKQSNYVGIDIADLAEANTYEKKDQDFSTTKSARGFHIVIDPGYAESLATIYAMLVERVKPFQGGAES